MSEVTLVDEEQEAFQRALLEADEIDLESLEAAAEMYDRLKNEN